ncbi:MAG TPA: MATE family efflux transporter [Fibrobacteria bacterium]|nr:MATE family efflux transporter [Fibrobacteria bacterium]HOX52042.1 MATE family efflux transporter [Fibrobacteria bacterium]
MRGRDEVEAELSKEKVGKLLVRYSLPAIVAMAASSLYNIVDRVFIGQGVGPYAIAGLAITLPVMNLAIALGAMVGVGAAALVSIRLGERRGDEAGRILGNTVFLNVVLGTVYSLLMYLFLDPILRLFGASDETIPYARDFLRIILLGNPFLHTYMGLNGIMRASGHPTKAMATTLATVGVNLVLAPLFIFVFGWGIRGAALATVASQLVGLVVVVSHFADKKRQIRFQRGIFAPHAAMIRDILAIGMSSFFVQVGASLVAVVMNRELVRHGGDFAVGAFGIVNSVLMLMVMVILGIAQGMQPIAGFNYGAKLYGRVMRVLRHAIVASTIVACAGFAATQLFPGPIASVFTSDTSLRAMAVQGMRWSFLCVPLAGFQIATANLFQSIGRAKLSIILTLSRQIGFLVPGLIVLPIFFGLSGVWAALPLSDAASTLLAWLVLRYERGRIAGLDQTPQD